MKFFFILLFFLAFISCSKSPGTNTGNPDNPSSPNNGDAPAIGVTTNVLGTNICGNIKKCFSISNETDCINQIQTLPIFTSEIALNPPYSNLNDLDSAYNNTSFVFNTSSLNSCLTAMNNLSCTDNLMVNSYNTSQVADYSNTYLLFRASSSCQSLKQQ